MTAINHWIFISFARQQIRMFFKFHLLNVHFSMPLHRKSGIWIPKRDGHVINHGFTSDSLLCEINITQTKMLTIKRERGTLKLIKPVQRA